MVLLASPFQTAPNREKHLTLHNRWLPRTIFSAVTASPPSLLLAMEDWNMLAADCVVISCCCQCLVLQAVVFVLLKLPCKLFQKAKAYAKKKLMMITGRREDKGIEMDMKPYEDELGDRQGGPVRIQVDGGLPKGGNHGCGCCMEEVERVMEEFSRRGEFAFGSFWGKGESHIEFESNVVANHH